MRRTNHWVAMASSALLLVARPAAADDGQAATPVDLSEEIGTELDGAMRTCANSLEKFTKQRYGSGDRKSQLPGLEKSRERYRKALKAAADAEQRQGYEALHDTFVVYGAQGLKAMTMVLEGARQSNDARVSEGFDLADLALQDLHALQNEAKAAATGEEPPDQGAETGYKYRGTSLGFNGTGTIGEDATTYLIAFNYSAPLWGDLDYGMEFFLGGGNTSDTSFGFRLRLRFNVIGLIESMPQLVPYIGLSGSQVVTGPGTNAIGIEHGYLVFVSRQMALTFDLRVDFTRDAQNAQADTATSIFLGTGLRYTL